MLKEKKKKKDLAESFNIDLEIVRKPEDKSTMTAVLTLFPG